MTYWPAKVIVPVGVFVGSLVAVAMIFFMLSSHPSRKASAAPKAARPALPPAQPDYTRSFQGILDAARPKGTKRIVVKDCRRGRLGNEHFCAWLGSDGNCRAGFILEDPANGTVPEKVGRVPLPATSCSTANVFAWLRSAKT